MKISIKDRKEVDRPEKIKCLECDREATMMRFTQFAGNHPFCRMHAEAEKDFGEDSSYVVWGPIAYPY